MTLPNKDKISVSLFVGPKIASGNLLFPEQTNLRVRDYEQNLSGTTSTLNPAVRATVAAVAVCSQKKFRLHVCSASCSCYEVSSLSDRAARTFREHIGRRILHLRYCFSRFAVGPLRTFRIYARRYRGQQ